MSEDKLSQMVSRADKAATGYISEDDFLEAFDWLMSQGQDERDYMAIFNMLVSEPSLRGRRDVCRDARDHLVSGQLALGVFDRIGW